ncbi:MAG: SMP-30/gluconolactonase/LRE family protein [Burkholderiales bacterium]|nr:SMP-30/gluconolactonase/LRE family protein [Burkholderiales bacterium]
MDCLPPLYWPPRVGGGRTADGCGGKYHRRAAARPVRTEGNVKRAGLAAAAVAVAAAHYLVLWPVPADPVAWQAPVAPGYAGAHAANRRLDGLHRIALGDEHGPEHVAIGPDGLVYAAVASGRILRLRPDGSGRDVHAETGGRVLGFAFDAAGDIIAADATRGLIAIGADRRPRLLADRVDGDPIRYANSVAIGPAGLVYFTDASRRFAPRDWGGTFEASVLDIVEQSATGRVLVHDRARGTTRVVAHGLAFANGIALNSTGDTLLVAETGRYRVWAIPAGANALHLPTALAQGTARVLLDNLPGYPDNITRGRDGRYWLGLAKPRSGAVDALAGLPALRQMILRLPRQLWPVPPAYGHVLAFTAEGRIVADLQDPTGAIPETTGATETEGRLYVHSLHAPVLAWLRWTP